MFNFKHHIIDRDLPPGLYGQTALADVDGDGTPEFITGAQYGTIYLYKFREPGRWDRCVLGQDSPSDVGAALLDVNGDGLPDLVTGGAWYRNPGAFGKSWERVVFDENLTAVHDVVIGDIDGDGRAEVLTMSDQNSLRWYKIPDDQKKPWVLNHIGPAVHAGLALGDIDGDGDLDIVRTDVWFENVKGDGTEWVEHFIGFNSPPPLDFTPYFAYYGTHAKVVDMRKKGFADIVFVDAEIPGGKVWWMENVDGDGLVWNRHDVYSGGPGPRRGAFHSLYAGDLDGDGDIDIFSCEMEGVPGERAPKYFIWENVDGLGEEWKEHTVLDANIGGHASMVADVTGNGLPDIISKPWNPREDNSNKGKPFVVFLENIGNEG